MKPRADLFEAIADNEALKIIQGEAQQYKDDEGYREGNMGAANNTLLIYQQIAMDEGYRRAMEEMKANALTGSKINIVERKKGWFEYIEDHNEIESLVPLIRRRINSKRQRQRMEKHWAERGLEWSEEQFILSMVIHTGWEHGYMKANTMEHMAKITCGGDQERADMILNIFNEIFTDKAMEKLGVTE